MIIMSHCRQRILVSCLVLIAVNSRFADAWTSVPLRISHHQSPSLAASSAVSTTSLSAKRRKNRDDDGLFDWYDSVDADATPEDVFWQEMERQKLLSKVTGAAAANGDAPTPTWTSSAQGSAAPAPAPVPDLAAVTPPSIAPGTPMTVSASSLTATATRSAPPPLTMPSPSPPTTQQQQPRRQRKEQQGQANVKSVDSVLSEYAAFAVADNWLDDDIRAYVEQQRPLDEDDLEAQFVAQQQLEQQGGSRSNSNLAYLLQSDDPWAQFGMSAEEAKDDRIVIDPNKNKEIWYDFDTDDGADADQEDAAQLERLSKIKASSPSLERARENPKAKAFFQREPNSLAGCDRMWVSAVDNACFSSLRGSLRNYGVDFACNFGDWEDGCFEDKFGCECAGF